MTLMTKDALGPTKSCEARPATLACTFSVVAKRELLQIVLNHMVLRSYETLEPNQAAAQQK